MMIRVIQMYRIIVVGIISIILYVGITSFDSLINLKVEDRNQTDSVLSTGMGIANAEENQLSSSSLEKEQVNSIDEESTPKVTANTPTNNTKANKKEPTETNKIPTVKELKQVAAIFFEELIQPTDDHYRVLDFNNKYVLQEHLMELASLHVVSYYINGLYEEQEGELYIIPMDSPPWIEESNPADLTKVNADEYILTQTNESDLHGHYKITISFKYIKNNWIITNVQVGQAI
jgi:hypothetical protein